MMRQITARNFLILIICLVSFWLVARALRNDSIWGPVATFEILPDNVDLTLKNIKYTKTRDGAPLWTLIADSAAHSMEDRITRIKNVRMVFFDREQGEIKLTADQGKLQPENQKVSVSSNVLLVNPQGNTLQTEHLEYDEVSNMLQTDRMVTINVDDSIVNGKGMQMDITKRTLVLLDDVQAQFDGIDSH